MTTAILNLTFNQPPSKIIKAHFIEAKVENITMRVKNVFEGRKCIVVYFAFPDGAFHFEYLAKEFIQRQIHIISEFTGRSSARTFFVRKEGQSNKNYCIFVKSVLERFFPHSNLIRELHHEKLDRLAKREITQGV